MSECSSTKRPHLRAIPLLILVVSLVAPAHAQTPTPSPDAHGATHNAPAKLDVFADFPKPPADLPFRPLDNAWPARWGMNGDIKGVIIDMDPLEPVVGLRTTLLLSANGTPDAKALAQAAPPAIPMPENFIYEGNGCFRYISDPKTDPPRRRETAPAMSFRFVSGERESNPKTAQPAIRLQRTWFNVFDPIQDKPKPRGVALLMPGLFGTPEGTLAQLTGVLRKNGWVVVRMLSQPSRFTERTEFELSAGGDLEAQARHIAEVFDDRSAECAYAAQAALAHVEDKRPELRNLPRIAIGFSGGAMTLPTVVAREPARYAAAVLVGGGADFWLMNERSNYKTLIDAIREKWEGPPPTAKDHARLDDFYLQNAALDSYNTAQSMKGVRVLMIQGAADMAVPAPLGDLLWLRIGKPERWIEDNAGHEAIFMMLPHRFDKIMDWLK